MCFLHIACARKYYKCVLWLLYHTALCLWNRPLPIAWCAGVMAIHMSLHNPNLLVVGCYDGSVAVYDVRNRHDAKPIFSSTPKSGSHSRPVWAVEWLSDQSGAAHAFHSLSSDGRLLHWTLGTAELTSQVSHSLTPFFEPIWASFIFLLRLVLIEQHSRKVCP